jgi:hypothetical protein
MNYQNKYLKYKTKYLNLKNQSGGFIKGIDKIVEKYNEATYGDLKTRLNEYMPLCSYDSIKKNNFILINDKNYILIDKKTDEDYKLFQLDNTFDISEIPKPHEMIKDDIVIPGINKFIFDKIHLIQAYQYNNNNIFRNFLSNVWITGYDFFNRLKDIIYKKFKGQILYQNNINVVLSFIFMNKFDFVLWHIFAVNILVTRIKELTREGKKIPEDYIIINYHVYNPIGKKNNIFSDIKTGILYDYLNAYDYLMIDALKNLDTFEKLVDNFNNTLSNIVTLNFNDQKDEFNLFLNIFKINYDHINENPNLIDQYNYSLYIDKYKDFNLYENKTTYKSLMRFINEYDRNYIKNKLILKLSCLIYLCHKINTELGASFRTAEYMLLDYFYGIGKIKNSCVPINQRQILTTMLELDDNQSLRSQPITNKFEEAFYKIFTQDFKEIKQYTFPDSYTDCGETTILNTFNYFLLKENGEFNLTDSDSWDPKLKKFYEKYPNMESMININIVQLKTDLAEVFNGRGDQIVYNNPVSQVDINTTVDNMIKTCAVLLNIQTDNFKDIFKKLKPTINIDDVVRDDTIIKYSDLFSLSLYYGHSEFNLNMNLIQNPFNSAGLSDLKNHWLNLWISNRVPLVPIYPKKFSLDHFKYYFYNRFDFFTEFPKDKQTEEICIEAVHPTQNLDDKYIVRYAYDNLDEVQNKTYKIFQAAVTFNGRALQHIPKELRDEFLCREAFANNIVSFKWIPHDKQEKSMIDKIRLIEDEKEKLRLLSFANPELL